MNKIFILNFLMIILITGCQTTQTVNNIESEPVIVDSSPFLRMKWGHNASFNSYMDPAKIQGLNSGGAYYSGAGGAAGVLAQIFAHSLISSSAQKKQFEDAQKLANKSLSPYQTKISSFVHSDLWKGVKAKDLNFKTYQEGDTTGVTVFESTPEFILAPDHKAIMLINHVEVYKSNNFTNSIYTNSYIVISKPVVTDDVQSYWNDESEKGFIEISSSAFADSIELAINDFNNTLNPSETHKTFRYSFGDKKMYERGLLIKNTCSGTVLKNLRGYIYKIPSNNPDIDCETLDDIQ